MKTALLLAALLWAPAALHAAAKPAQPNFIVISIDDLGYADVGPFGATHPTPQLDRMAREGRVFTNFYVAASVCTPSRAALMTGCYPPRIDMLTNDLEMKSPNHGVLWPGDRKGLNPSEETVAEVLKARGYTTACIGKWHLGDQPEFLPTRQGFDEYFGIPFSNDMGTSDPFNVPLPLVRGEKVVQELTDADQDLLTKRYTEEAIDFIGRNAKQPFFLYLPHAMVHAPLHVSPASKDKTGKGMYADAVAEIDWSVGQILDKLKAAGVAENTLVIFTSDNGKLSANSPLSGGKKSSAEGGFRVPMIAWWPGVILGGSRCDLMASTLDLLPTFATLSGKPHAPAPGKPIDGLDLNPLFRADVPAQSARDTFAYFSNSDDPASPRDTVLDAVREGKWKLFLKPQRVGRVKPGALFDLEADTREAKDISAQNPDVVERLKALAKQYATELGDIGVTGSSVRKAGFVPAAKPLNPKSEAAARPKDILFIAIDDMNDWSTLFSPENPIKTPNIEKLAARGAFFTRAYCASPGCNPSRTAILTGLLPSSSGVYENNHAWRAALPEVVTLPKYFENHGYATRGAGKIFQHGRTGEEPPNDLSFQEFLKLQPSPEPQIRKGAYGPFDWGIVTEKLTDEYTIDWVCARMEDQPRDRPLFLAAGLFHPHLPHFAPPAFFAQYPLDRVVQPPMPKGDLDDVPPLGIERAHCEHNWSGYLFGKDAPPDEYPASLKRLVQAYQASSSYSDSMVGRLMAKLDATGRSENTIIVLWSDHGYHLGDKESVVKFTLWEKANHVPFIIVAPGVVKAGTRIATPVSLVNLYPTLVELAGLPVKAGLDGQSLVPLLKDPTTSWERPALMTQGRGNHAVRSQDWRYIRYHDGTEELYDQRTDPWNHTNLLKTDKASEYASIVTQHRAWLPKTDAPEPSPPRRVGAGKKKTKTK